MASLNKHGANVKDNSNNKILNMLNDMFQHILHPEIIESVAQSQQFNVDATRKILSEMIENAVPNSKSSSKNITKQISPLNTVAYGEEADADDVDVLIENEGVATLAYSKSVGKKSKRNPAPRAALIARAPSKSNKQVDVDRVCSKLLYGSKVMILLRGLPGSGKSHLACNILRRIFDNTCDPAEFIFSTDYYFVIRGQYKFNPMLLQEAHTWNQKRVLEAVRRGVSPVIVDNTNIQAWEMRPYAMLAVQYGYDLELLEPDTTWAWHIPELTRRNQHQVPRQRIADMAQRYERNITSEHLLSLFCLRYAPNKHPPQSRRYPIRQTPMMQRPNRSKHHLSHINKLLIDEPNITVTNSEPAQDDKDIWESDNDGTWEVVPQKNILSSSKSDTKEYVLVHPDNSLTFQKDHSSADEVIETQDLINFDDPTPDFGITHIQDDLSQLNLQKNDMESTHTAYPCKENFEFPKLDFDNFKADVKCAPDLYSNYSQKLLATMEVKDVSTNTNSSDFLMLMRKDAQMDIEGKVLLGKVRDINCDYQTKHYKPPPKILMLHKGTMTNEDLDNCGQTDKCEKKGEHLGILTRLFPRVQPDALCDMLDKCQGNVNWAVDILLESCDDTFELGTEVRDDITSSTTCSCTNNSGMNLASNISNSQTTDQDALDNQNIDVIKDNQLDNDTIELNMAKQNKIRNKTSADDPIKKYIEEQFKISDEHYSQYLLNLRRKRHGEVEAPKTIVEIEEGEIEPTICDDETSEEEFLELRLGDDLVSQLETYFGEVETCSENGIKHVASGFQPVVQVPCNIARQLHALWLQSVYTQMAAQNSVMEEVERQDAQLALQLQQRESELAQSTFDTPPPTPDLHEIMDMEIALAVYRADQQLWKRETPQDMASRMTRQKLFETFPEIDNEVLLEVLQAHENNFQQTVDVLISSLGRQPDHNLVNIAEQHRLLEHAKTQTIEEHVPDELDENGQPVRTTASYYREKAAHHLHMREQLFHKAQQSIQKGLPQVASYYSDVAKLHMHKYELANNRAACAFLSEHSAAGRGGHTIDLHYLYVREAEQALAVFLDAHISRLQQTTRLHDSLFIITGRGKRSIGGVSHIKPAVKRHLRQRKLKYTEVNPGLLKVTVTKHSILTNDLKDS